MRGNGGACFAIGEGTTRTAKREGGEDLLLLARCRQVFVKERSISCAMPHDGRLVDAPQELLALLLLAIARGVDDLPRVIGQQVAHVDDGPRRVRRLERGRVRFGPRARTVERRAERLVARLRRTALVARPTYDDP